jgi:septum formation protein
MLFLASRSPRRSELLRQLGLRFDVLDVSIEEIRRAGEPAEDYVSRVAREKAGAGLLQVGAVAGAVVLGADTEVVLDGEVFGKPADAAAAAQMLRRLSGRTHRVISDLWCLTAAGETHRSCRSEVSFGSLCEADIAAYVATGEPFGKAGGYAIQGRAAAFVRHLAGSYSGVMGLPLFETAALLHGAGCWPLDGAAPSR